MSTYMLLMGLMLCAATFFSSTADAKNKPGDSILRHKPIKAVNFPGVKVKEDSLKNNKGSVHVRLGKQDKVDEELVNERKLSLAASCIMYQQSALHVHTIHLPHVCICYC